MPNSHAASLQTDTELLCDLLHKLQKHKSVQSHSLVSPGNKRIYFTSQVQGAKSFNSARRGVKHESCLLVSLMLPTDAGHIHTDPGTQARAISPLHP